MITFTCDRCGREGRQDEFITLIFKFSRCDTQLCRECFRDMARELGYSSSGECLRGLEEAGACSPSVST